MRIYVETQNSERLAVDVEGESVSVRSVKEKVKMLKSVPVEEQTLQFGGRDLRDDETLEQCGIRPEHTLQVIINMRRSTTL